MKLLVFMIFFTVINASLFAGGRKDNVDSSQQPLLLPPTISSFDSAEDSESPLVIEDEGAVKLIGRVQIYGSEPHTFVGIVDENSNEYAIYPESQGEALRRLQGHLIEFAVIFMDEPRGYGAMFLRGGTVTILGWEIIR